MRSLRRFSEWFTGSLGFIWLPIILIVLAGLAWMIFGKCTTERCQDSQTFMKLLVEQLNSSK